MVYQRRAVDSIVATVLVVAVALFASLAASGFIFGVTSRAQDTSQIAVTGTALPANYFTAGGSTSTFTCGSAPSGAYLTLTNTGTGGASVAGVSITWAGSNTAFTLSGGCDVGASGSATSTQFIVFPATSAVSTDALVGQTYTGSVTLSNGAQLLLTGTWQ